MNPLPSATADQDSDIGMVAQKRSECRAYDVQEQLLSRCDAHLWGDGQRALFEEVLRYMVHPLDHLSKEIQQESSLSRELGTSAPAVKQP